MKNVWRLITLVMLIISSACLTLGRFEISQASWDGNAPKDNIFTKTAQFLREVKVELKKVTWPSRKQTIGSTAVVIALVMIISLFLGVVDFGISSLIRIVLQ